MPASPLMQAFMGGGGAEAPSPFRAPPGIPDARVRAAPPASPASAGPSVFADLRSGAISAEQLLALIAQLAGLGQAPPMRQPGPDMREAFMGR